MTADSDADDVFTSKIVFLALEAGSNVVFLGCMTRGVDFQLFQLCCPFEAQPEFQRLHAFSTQAGSRNRTSLLRLALQINLNVDSFLHQLEKIFTFS